MENNNVVVSPVSTDTEVQVPELRWEEVAAALLEGWGIAADAVRRLDGYDDRNFHLTQLSAPTHNAALPTPLPQQGLVLKITNPVEAAVDGLMDGQTAFCRHLVTAGLPSPTLLPRIDGRFWAAHSFTTPNNQLLKLPLRLMLFAPGTTLKPHMLNSALLFDIGQLAANIRIAAKDFHHHVYDTYKTHWALELAGACAPFAEPLPHQWQKELVTDVLRRFNHALHNLKPRLPYGPLYHTVTQAWA